MTSTYLYDFNFELINNETLNLRALKGHTILLSNVASKCGFNHQLKEFILLSKKFSQQPLKIILTPDASFMDQEVHDICQLKDHYTYLHSNSILITKKLSVKGKNQHPLYERIHQEVGFLGKIRWNYYKFIFDNQGNLYSWYTSLTKPISKKMIKDLSTVLAR